jgi:quercetin dioxygenase-like cupin family protein
MFLKHAENGYTPAAPGIELKTLVHGKNTLMAQFRLKKGSTLPRHSHMHEQTGYLISGSIRLTIGDMEHRVDPGDSWCIPENMEHCAEIVEDALAIEVFSPVREDYLPGTR